MQKRSLIVAVVLVTFVLSYYGVAAWAPQGLGRSLELPVDLSIPFIPTAVFVYMSVYVGVVLPWYTVPSAVLFSRVAMAYVALIVVSGFVFAVFPVSAETLRPILPVIAEPSFTEWMIRLLYVIDPPTNLFPSLHVSLALCSAGMSWKSDRRLGLYVWPWFFAVCVATCVTKQHYVVDVVAGAVLGGVALLVSTRGVTLDTDASTQPPVFEQLKRPAALYGSSVGAFFAAYWVA